MKARKPDQLLSELACLRISTLKYHDSLKNGLRAREFVTSILRKLLTDAEKSGVIEVLRDLKTGSARAAFILAFETPFYSTKLAPTARLILRHGEQVSDDWIRTLLKKHRAFFTSEFVMLLDAQNLNFLEDLSSLNIHIESVILAGEPRKAILSLKKKYGNLKWEKYTEFPGRELRTAKEVDAVMKTLKREFTRDPQFGWFVASKAFLARERKMLNRERKKPLATHFIIINDRGNIAGHFGFEIDQNNIFGHRMASMALNFDQSIQGKGLAKLAYFLLLKKMIKLKIGIFQGGTSQKPVLALSRTMRRLLVSYAMKKGKPHFLREYFLYG